MADVACVVVNGAGAVVGIAATSANLTETYVQSRNPNEGMRKILIKDADAIASIAADGSDSTKTEAQRLAAIVAGVNTDGGLPVFAKPSYVTSTQIQNGDMLAASDPINDIYGPSAANVPYRS